MNATEKYGNAPLHMAVRYNARPEAKHCTLKGLRLLLEAGADANIIDNSGKKALDYAKDHSFLTGTDEYRLLEQRTSPN